MFLCMFNIQLFIKKKKQPTTRNIQILQSEREDFTLVTFVITKMGNRYLLTVRADKWVLFCPSAPGIKQTTFFLSTVFNVVAHHLFSAKDFKIQTKTWLQSDGWLSPYSGKLFSLFHITFYNRKSPSLKWLQGNPSEKADYLLAMLIFISLSHSPQGHLRSH